MADTDHVLMLAAIIREVDGNHSRGAAALSESILDHPDFHKCCTAPSRPADQEQELAALDQADKGLSESEWQQRSDTIRRALKQLND